MNRTDLQAAVESAGFQLVDDDEHDEAAADADADLAAGTAAYTTEDLAELRRRYLGDAAVGADGLLIDEDGDEPDAADEGFEDELVVVVPKGRGAAFGHGPGPKSVVISGKNGQVLGAQG